MDRSTYPTVVGKLNGVMNRTANAETISTQQHKDSPCTPMRGDSLLITQKDTKSYKELKIINYCVIFSFFSGGIFSQSNISLLVYYCGYYVYEIPSFCINFLYYFEEIF